MITAWEGEKWDGVVFCVRKYELLSQGGHWMSRMEQCSMIRNENIERRGIICNTEDESRQYKVAFHHIGSLRERYSVMYVQSNPFLLFVEFRGH